MWNDKNVIWPGRVISILSNEQGVKFSINCLNVGCFEIIAYNEISSKINAARKYHVGEIVNIPLNIKVNGFLFNKIYLFIYLFMFLLLL